MKYSKSLTLSLLALIVTASLLLLSFQQPQAIHHSLAVYGRADLDKYYFWDARQGKTVETSLNTVLGEMSKQGYRIAFVTETIQVHGFRHGTIYFEK